MKKMFACLAVGTVMSVAAVAQSVAPAASTGCSSAPKAAACCKAGTSAAKCSSMTAAAKTAETPVGVSPTFVAAPAVQPKSTVVVASKKEAAAKQD